MNTITAKELHERENQSLPTCYIDVRSQAQTLTFTIVDHTHNSRIFGGLRCSMGEIKDKLPALVLWAKDKNAPLFVLGCTTPHKYSQGVAAMLPILKEAGLNAVSIFGSHYEVWNAKPLRLPKLIV